MRFGHHRRSGESTRPHHRYGRGRFRHEKRRDCAVEKIGVTAATWRLLALTELALRRRVQRAAQREATCPAQTSAGAKD